VSAAAAIYRTKPDQVEALQWKGDITALADWMKRLGGVPIVLSPLPAVTVQTQRGNVVANVGDWIIRGPDGDFWPCPAADFAEKYEPV
jgi:hypothetical protein